MLKYRCNCGQWDNANLVDRHLIEQNRHPKVCRKCESDISSENGEIREYDNWVDYRLDRSSNFIENYWWKLIAWLGRY